MRQKPSGEKLVSTLLPTIDPKEIADNRMRQTVELLLNFIEELNSKVKELSLENQRLKDENNRLKGEQGKPDIKAKKPRVLSRNYSSEKERKTPKKHSKSRKQEHIKIDREKIVEYPQDKLPVDAEFKGYEEVIVQDIKLSTDNILFRKQKYYSPSEKKTYKRRTTCRVQGRIRSRSKSPSHQPLLWWQYDPRQNIRVFRGYWHLYFLRSFI